MTTRVRRYRDAFEAVGFPPGEAELLRIRADLMIELTRLIEKQGLTQSQAAELLGVTQAPVSALMRGKIDRFSIDTLVTMLSHSGANVAVKVRRRRSVA